MARAVRIYPPEERRYLAENLLCPSCGNTTAFAMDLRLRHRVDIQPGGMEIGLDKVPTTKLLRALQQNLHKVLDKGFLEEKPKISCANCGDNESVDLLERVMDTCWNSGCPGCWWCGQYISEEQVLELCSDCITSKDGEITHETCEYACPHYDYGLDEVRTHYGLTLEGLIQNLGYSQPVAC